MRKGRGSAPAPRVCRGGFAPSDSPTGAFLKEGPSTPRTFISRKTSRKFASQIICVFGKEKGKKYLLSHTIPNPRPASVWIDSDRPHSIQNLTQDCHCEKSFVSDSQTQPAISPTRETNGFIRPPSVFVGVPTNKSFRKHRRQGAVTPPLFGKRTVPPKGCGGF
jgi:hypothetical protein